MDKIKHLRMHIVCFDVPYPPDYGGAADLYYKIKWLHAAGVAIVLHCFEYGRGRQEELEKYCESVFYYPRRKSLNFTLPYIVSSRKSKALINRLLIDDDPVLFEGIHCTYYIDNNALQKKNSWIRLHNIEYKYYAHLAKTTSSIFKKIYFLAESVLLKKYEKKLAPHNKYLAINRNDGNEYKSFNALEVKYLPVFLPYTKCRSLEGVGKFCLYHGNLSVPENEKAVTGLIKNIFSKVDFPIIIAGKDPGRNILSLCKKFGIDCIPNPGEEQLNELIKKAHIHVLPSLNATGTKIKLLNALFKGRFIITNKAGVTGTGLEELCFTIESPEEIIDKIKSLVSIPFSDKETERRNAILLKEYDSQKNAQKLIEIIFG